MGKGYKHISRV